MHVVISWVTNNRIIKRSDYSTRRYSSQVYRDSACQHTCEGLGGWEVEERLFHAGRGFVSSWTYHAEVTVGIWNPEDPPAASPCQYLPNPAKYLSQEHLHLCIHPLIDSFIPKTNPYWGVPGTILGLGLWKWTKNNPRPQQTHTLLKHSETRLPQTLMCKQGTWESFGSRKGLEILHL